MAPARWGNLARICIAVVATIACVFIMNAPAAASEQTRVDGMIYYVPINYDDSLYKEDAMVKGAYLYYGYKDTSYEGAVEYTDITYNPDIGYEQKDYTFVFSKYTESKKTRYGLHHTTTNTDSNDGNTFFVGSSNYSNPEKTKIINVYYSRYSDQNESVKALQFSPAIATTQYKKGDKTFSALTSLHYIRLDDEIGLENDNFVSIEQSITFYRERAAFTLDGWLGERMYYVGSEGFAVYNKPELSEGGYGASLRYTLSDDASFTVGYNVDKFKDSYSNNGAKAESYTYLLEHTF